MSALYAVIYVAVGMFAVWFYYAILKQIDKLPPKTKEPKYSSIMLEGLKMTPDGIEEISIQEAGNIIQDNCHLASFNAGWWNDLETGESLIEYDVHTDSVMINRPHLISEKLMLIVSEISEAMEGHRKNLMDDKLPHRSMLEVELADAVIRIGDLCGALNLDLGGAIAEKLAYNHTREDHKIENRRGANGKKF